MTRKAVDCDYCGKRDLEAFHILTVVGRKDAGISSLAGFQTQSRAMFDTMVESWRAHVCNDCCERAKDAVHAALESGRLFQLIDDDMPNGLGRLGPSP